MKNLITTLLVAFIAGVLCFPVYAQQKSKMGSGMMSQGMMMGKKQMSAGNQMPMMMTKMMMKKIVVPTEDGGVVLMIGNKLFKYDKKLKLTGETTVNITQADYQNMVKTAWNACPMMTNNPASNKKSK